MRTKATRGLCLALGVLVLAACNYHREKVAAPLQPMALSIQTRFVETRCFPCHKGSTPAGHVNLENIAGEMKHPTSRGPHDHRPPLFVPGCPEKSLFFMKLTDSDAPMPPDDSGLDRASPQEMKAVADWILSQSDKRCGPDKSEPGTPDEPLDPSGTGGL